MTTAEFYQQKKRYWDNRAALLDDETTPVYFAARNYLDWIDGITDGAPYGYDEHDLRALSLVWRDSYAATRCRSLYPVLYDCLYQFLLTAFDAVKHQSLPCVVPINSDDLTEAREQEAFWVSYKEQYDYLKEEIESIEFMEKLVDTEDGLKVDAELVEA